MTRRKRKTEKDVSCTAIIQEFLCDLNRTLISSNELTKCTEEDTSRAALTAFKIKSHWDLLTNTKWKANVLYLYRSFLRSRREQTWRSADGFIKRWAFEIILRSHICYHKILWLTCLLSLHKQTTPGFNWKRDETALSWPSWSACFVSHPGANSVLT